MSADNISLQDAASLVGEAVHHGITAAAPILVGDHGLLVRRPADWVAQVIDVRDHEDNPRERAGKFNFATVDSLIRYIERFKDETTLGYITDVTSKGVNALTSEVYAAHYVLDDFRMDPPVANRKHQAHLVLRPTTAARRWGQAFQKKLNQLEMVELVIDGTGEIAAPDSADLRDLISDLHAIRTASAKSVVRVSGGLAVEVTDNVALHAGQGNLVTVPESITLVLQPWTAVDATITVEVKVRPIINGETVLFGLSAPHLEEALNDVLRTIHSDLATGTGIEPFWTA